MSDPRIDVLIPAFNCEKTIAESVHSILAQTVTSIRILVIDDGSTDRTAALVSSIAADDPRVVLHSVPNGGIVDALNFGLSHCRAPLIARHDGDDLAYADRFARQLRYLDDHPDCLAVGAYARLIDENGIPTGGYSRPGPADESDPTRPPAREPYLLHPFLLARRAAIEQVGRYRHVYLAEDSDLYWRLEEIGTLFNIPEVLGDYRVHSGSVTSKSIVRGRQNAVFSELAALSARRRRAGLADIDFGPTLVRSVQATDGCEAILDVAKKILREDESAWLRPAMALKLIELTYTRHYQLELEDCRFVRRSLEGAWKSLSSRHRSWASEMVVLGCKSLVAQGEFQRAVALSPPVLYPKVVGRIAFRTLLPDSVRTGIKRAMKRA